MNIYDAHCHMCGEGDPVVIVHPFIKDAFSDNAMLVNLSQQFRIYSVTLPGLNDIYPDLPENMDQIKEFLDKLLHNKYLDSFILIGISIAGSVALQYTIAHPEKVKKLILISPSGMRSFFPFLQFTPVQSIFRSMLRNKLRTKKTFNRLLNRLLYTSTFQTGHYLPAEAFKKDSQWPERAANIIAFLSKKMSGMIRQCHLIKKPVLLIGGKNDKLVSPSVLCNFEGQFQSVNLQLIDDAGHLSVLENPEEYFVKIEQFV